MLAVTLLAATSQLSRVCAQTIPQDPTLAVLHDAVKDITIQLTTQAQSLPDKEKNTLLQLAKKQQDQLDTVEAKHAADTHPLSKVELNSELSGLFATGARIQKFFPLPKNSIHAEGYSPDPQQCASHCKQACGYNTLGEKVCWYSCYRCCGRGGC
jgi:hypothetical protein